MEKQIKGLPWNKVLDGSVEHTITGDVQIIKDFDMPQLGSSRNIWIYLPPGYEESDKYYPVLYMQDGQNVFDEKTASYGSEWKVDEHLEALVKENAGNEVIVVAIDSHPTERPNEYNVVHSTEHNISGCGEEYIAFMVNTLKPFIDRHFRTKTEREHTTIAGSSFGAYISLYAALLHPQVFGKVAAFSLMHWQDNGILVDLIKHTPQTRPVRYYINVGDQESDKPHEAQELVEHTEKVYQALLQAGYEETHIKFEVIQSGRHHETTWSKTFPGAFLWLMKGFS